MINLGPIRKYKKELYSVLFNLVGKRLGLYPKNRKEPFKVGDWVRSKYAGGYQLVDEILLDSITYNAWEDNYELWQPTKGEYCVMWLSTVVPHQYSVIQYTGEIDDEYYTYHEDGMSVAVDCIAPIELIETLKEV